MLTEHDLVKVLVGQYDKSAGKAGRFSGFWAEFKGEEVSSYKDKDGVLYTLYRCTAYKGEAYRVHISDETNPQAPVYKLEPYHTRNDYTETYGTEQIAEKYPLFLKHLNYLKAHYIDPGP